MKTRKHCGIYTRQQIAIRTCDFPHIAIHKQRLLTSDSKNVCSQMQAGTEESCGAMRCRRPCKVPISDHVVQIDYVHHRVDAEGNG